MTDMNAAAHDTSNDGSTPGGGGESDRLGSRSSTLRSDGGYRTYIITTRRITSGELLKYRNGLLMA
jgi:hypothetical protein